MAEFKPTEIWQYPRVGQQATLSTAYWKRLGFPVAIKDYGAIDYIDFSVEEPYCFAVTSSAKVQIYTPLTNEVTRSFTRFRRTAFGGTFRSDGKLLAAGSDDGFVHLFNVETKSLLRIFKGHRAPTHRCKFSKDGQHIISFSDDKSVGLWDIPSETKVLTFQEHEDYIRTGAASQSSQDIFISGSYDHTVKMYDTRTSKSVISVNHGSPVESVLMFPSSSVFLSAGGTTVKVWDAASGHLLTQLAQHHKTVTCLHFASNGKRLLSGSLDRHVKIYDVSTYQVDYTIDYPSAILSVAAAPDDKVVVAGMSDGLISIRHQRAPKEPVPPQMKRKTFYNYRTYGADYKSAESDIVIHQEVGRKLPDYDRYLRTFQSSRALDVVLKNYTSRKKPHVAVCVIQELIRRGALKAALAGRDPKTLAPVLKFTTKYIGDPRFTRVCMTVARELIDIYSSKLGDQSIRQQFKYLQQALKTEVKYQKEMMEVYGIIRTIMAVSRAHSNPSLPLPDMNHETEPLIPSTTAKSL